MGSDWIEVLVFAGVAAFVAWRLISVLGTRTGHEPTAQPDGDGFGPPAPVSLPPSSNREAPARTAPVQLPAHWTDDLKTKVTEVVDADHSFEPQAFVNGARIAYGLILNAFWAGDVAALKPLLSDDVLRDFSRAIEARGEQKTLGNRLISIDAIEVVDASVEGAMAEVTVRIDARIEDAQGSHAERDVWSFSRHVRASDPTWLLIATDTD